MEKSDAILKVERARNGKMGVRAGRFFSISQLATLIDPATYLSGKPPVGFIFQVGKLEGHKRRFTIEIIPYEYDDSVVERINYESHDEDGVEKVGFLRVNLGLPKPGDRTFPNPGEPNELRIDNSPGGGGLGAAQAYPTPSH